MFVWLTVTVKTCIIMIALVAVCLLYQPIRDDRSLLSSGTNKIRVLAISEHYFRMMLIMMTVSTHIYFEVLWSAKLADRTLSWLHVLCPSKNKWIISESSRYGFQPASSVSQCCTAAWFRLERALCWVNCTSWHVYNCTTRISVGFYCWFHWPTRLWRAQH